VRGNHASARMCFNGAAIDRRRRVPQSCRSRREWQCFNGAAIDRRRRGHGRGHRRPGPAQRFNGAAIDRRRRADGPTSGGPTSRGRFNGAAIDRRRRGARVARRKSEQRASTEPPSIDGGEERASRLASTGSGASTEPPSIDGGERGGAPRALARESSASTEPPSIDGGEHGGRARCCGACRASTEPPSIDGGENESERPSGVGFDALQRSRHRSTAESGRWSPRPADVELASTEPPSIDGGEIMSWVRGSSTVLASTEPPSIDGGEIMSLWIGRIDASCFNGAAIDRRRRDPRREPGQKDEP